MQDGAGVRRNTTWHGCIVCRAPFQPDRFAPPVARRAITARFLRLEGQLKIGSRAGRIDLTAHQLATQRKAIQLGGNQCQGGTASRDGFEINLTLLDAW